MKKGTFSFLPVILAVAAIIVSIAAEWLYLGDFEYRYRTGRFNRIIKERQAVMKECLNGMLPILAKGEPHGSASENALFTLAAGNGITILEYFDNRLAFWSDTEFDVPRRLTDTTFSQPLIFMQNGWFLTNSIKAGNEKIVTLLRIRSDYGFENNIIRNGFEDEFRIPPGVGFSRDRKSSPYSIYDDSGNYLFSLVFPAVKEKTPLISIPLILWGVSFLLLLSLTLSLVKYLTDRNRHIAALIVSFIIFSIVYLTVLVTGKPSILFKTDLFTPYRYTMNAFIPSLGHLAMLSVLLSAFAYIIYRYIPENKKLRSIQKPGYPLLTLLLLPGAFLFLLYHLIFSHLIFNANTNFETFKVLDLDFFSLVGFISAALLFCVPFLYILKVFRNLTAPTPRNIIFAALTTLLVFAGFLYHDHGMLIVLSLFYLLILIAIWLSDRENTGVFNKTVIYALIGGLYSLFLIIFLSEKKTDEKTKIQLVSYSTENDPTAEHLLLDMWPKITGDSLLSDMMDMRTFDKEDFDSISDYLLDRYFNGYWANYTLNIVICRKNDSLRVGEPYTIYEDCFNFFNRKIQLYGHRLTGTDFYFVDNNQGRSNYLGTIFFKYSGRRINGLYIDLYNDINVFQPGYSELLLDKKYYSYARLKDYSFAKYINGEIALRTGEFPYDRIDAEYVKNVNDYRLFRADSWKHVLYRNGNTTVLISRPAITIRDLVVSFAYLFAFILIFSHFANLLAKRPVLKSLRGLNFRQKMQLSFISILLFSFTLIGFVIGSLSIRQYQRNHYDNLKEKLNSVYMELESNLSMEKVLSPGWKNSNYGSLSEFLVKLSNIFNTDINLYDRTGFMIATSRPEIFFRNLSSRRINEIAFINLDNLKKSEYIQKEMVGKLEYISGYLPFYNIDNELLTYLNLPYFRMQSVLAREISNMIVTVINFTLLLIVLAMGLAVFISSRLTAPLALLSSRLASVMLGRKSEHLSYKGTDEVGELVTQYNRMVDELDESARKLANSEREYAWREMAKQVAHEIKNPLTPMKLNVQQLLKSWTDGVPGFEKKLERFTKNQIEYIDNLSSIASAFSSFAKVPETKPVTVDLTGQIKTTLELFKNTDNITFRIGWPHMGRVYIYADREQINGIFSNLIKNGIQSIPPGKEGIIRVNVETGGDKVIVSVADNGTGIPDPLKKKMFTPNFTTKSSGAGLGLSIVKRYVENASGRIWFESEIDKGSVFYIEFPLLSAGGDQVGQ
ncbi:MAG: HAMP domain-containing sensor histidine kinase [Bacteroidota bacterium]|nr:HAMP domain-containing sensor histidine kinase [Bacteroidota bacterium]